MSASYSNITENLLCIVPITRRLLFPQERLAVHFGRGDAEYAWGVFQPHFNRLQNAGFISAERILEIGPGRNLGTALLWWAYCETRRGAPAEVICWDVFKNAAPEISGFWSKLAWELLDTLSGWFQETESDRLQARPHEVAEGLRPRITYCVKPLKELEDAMNAEHMQFDLVYSRAAIEHIWDIEAFWETMARLTRSGGWHSHYIDLADHGQRDTNYIRNAGMVAVGLLVDRPIYTRCNQPLARRALYR
ncbi:MAG: class I SAM-dependent methyltransferase [Candidatus Thiosymbion ectosymbiont of Robbea hypermnestra]|nr:class I SAM-dependent methyltransferase [Candidatus Thiosymbion ectosymbiont of Robbea hypermnestra]